MSRIPRLCLTAQRSMSAVAGEGSRAIQKLPKPKMKDFFRDQLVKTFYLALPGSVILSLGYYVFMVQKRRKMYEKWEINQTSEKHMEDFERMRQLGVFQSCPPDGEEFKEFV